MSRRCVRLSPWLDVKTHVETWQTRGRGARRRRRGRRRPGRRCDGACAGEETAEDHNARLLSALDRDRIAAWPFPGALALLERNINPLPQQPDRQYHLVHHWAYMGTFATLSEITGELSKDTQRLFDRDGYHLLLSALHKGRLEILDAKSGQSLDNPLLGAGRDA